VGIRQRERPHDLEVRLRAARLHRALEKAGLRGIRFHHLRHTFASRLLHNRESVIVKDQLGHHSIRVTVDVDVYGHLVPGTTRRPWIGWMIRLCFLRIGGIGSDWRDYAWAA